MDTNEILKAFLIIILFEFLIFNWCIMSISSELKNIRKEIEKGNILNISKAR